MDKISAAIQQHHLKRQGQIGLDFQSKTLSGKVLEKGGSLKFAGKGMFKDKKAGGDHWITIRGRHILIGAGGEVKAGGKGMADGNDIARIGNKNFTSGRSKKESSGPDYDTRDQEGKKVNTKSSKDDTHRVSYSKENNTHQVVKNGHLVSDHTTEEAAVKDAESRNISSESKKQDKKQKPSKSDLDRVNSAKKKGRGPDKKKRFQSARSPRRDDEGKFTTRDKQIASGKYENTGHGLVKKPSDKDLAATEFESTYSKKEAKKYAEGGVPTPKKKVELISNDELQKHILPMVDDIMKNGMFSNRKEATQYAREYYLENKNKK